MNQKTMRLSKSSIFKILAGAILLVLPDFTKNSFIISTLIFIGIHLL